METTPAGARAAYASLDEMLEPEVLTSILGRPVEHVLRKPFATDHSTTDATFEAIHLDGQLRSSLVAKTVDRDTDWVAVATFDQVDREVRTWESGILSRLHGPATHAVVAAARTEAGYSVLMHDVSDHLFPGQSRIRDGQQGTVLEALASMHATFWMDSSLMDSFHGLASLSSFVGHCAPRTIERIHLRMSHTPFIAWLEQGWDKLPTMTDPRLAEDLRAIADDPSLLVEAMSALPWTLVHTDPRPANLALDLESSNVCFLDWARPALAPPAIDLVYWLFTANEEAPAPREDLIESYAALLRERLGSRFSSAWWEPQLDLCIVAFVACFAPIIAGVNPDAVAGWTERCRPGLRALR